MNHPNFNSENTILGGAIFCIVLLSAFQFISCKNFLNAKDIKNEIEEAIAYNNAKEITLQIDSDGMGLITPNGAVTKKTGYEFEITFKPDTQNYAIKDTNNILKAVDYYNHDKIYDTQSVVFTTQPQTDDDKINGIYRIKVLVKTEIKNLLIIPTSLPIPKVLSFSPTFDNAGYPQDTPIQIKFSSPVSLSDFVDENGYLKNVSIFNDDVDLLDRTGNKLPYFSNPTLSDDGLVLTIPTVNGNFLISATETVGFKDISVTLNLKNLMDLNGTSFQEESLSFTYRVNSRKDTVLPVLKKLNIARTKEDAINGTNLISIGNSEEDFFYNSEHCTVQIKEHHVKDFWVYFEAEDEGSGVQSLEITEQLWYRIDTDSKKLDGNVYSKRVENEVVTDKNFSGVFNYIFDTTEDGLINVEFSVKDRANNKIREKEKLHVLLLKDTTGDANFTIQKTDFTNVNSQNEVIFNFSLSFDENCFWILKNETSYSYCYEFVNPKKRNNWIDEKNEVLSIQYGYDMQNLDSLPLPVSFDSGGLANESYSITINPHKTVYIKVTVKDSVGNVKDITYPIAPVQEIATYEIKEVEELSEQKTKLFFYGLDPTVVTAGYFELRNAQGELIKWSVDTGTIPDSNYMLSAWFLFLGITEPQIEKITWHDGSEDLIKDLTDGYLTVYVLSAYACNYYKGKPITIDLSARTAPTLSAEVPDFEVEKLPVVINSSKTYFKLKNFTNSQGGDFEANSQYTYFVKYYKGEDEASAKYIKIDSFSNSIEIELPNDVCTYNFQIMAADNQGRRVCSSVESVSLLAADDSTPPLLGGEGGLITFLMGEFCRWEESSTNRLVVKDFIQETGSMFQEEIYEDEYGVYKVVPIKYYFTYLRNSENIDWNAAYIRTAYLFKEQISSKKDNDPHIYDPYIEIPRDGVKGDYFHALLQDKNGNTGTYVANMTPVVWQYSICEKTDGDLTRGDLYIEGSDSVNKYISINYVENNTWKYINAMGSNYRKVFGVKIDSPKGFKLGIGYDDTEKNSFVRVTLCNMNDSTHALNELGKSLYYCPDYYTGDVTCNLKGTYNTEFGLAILSDPDSPCMAHTFYCSTNLGDELEEWLYYGMETSLKMNYGSFTYTPDNYDAIPQGKYYTTIIHFADGTMTMTDVKQKN